jgi:hypothetical protein
MQLRSARLCMDCDEVHDLQQCPQCASETFAFITRWVPVPDRPQKRARPLDASDPEALSTYRELLQPELRPASGWKAIRRGALGLALFGVAGWLWRQNTRPAAEAGRQDTDETSRPGGQPPG